MIMYQKDILWELYVRLLHNETDGASEMSFVHVMLHGSWLYMYMTHDYVCL